MGQGALRKRGTWDRKVSAEGRWPSMCQGEVRVRSLLPAQRGQPCRHPDGSHPSVGGSRPPRPFLCMISRNHWHLDPVVTQATLSSPASPVTRATLPKRPS